MKAGMRLKSAVCDAEVMLIKAEDGGELSCGGKPMVEDAPSEKAEPDADHRHGCLIGKRYVNADGTIEVLCVKGGDGSLYYNGEELMTKDTKVLPSSD